MFFENILTFSSLDACDDAVYNLYDVTFKVDIPDFAEKDKKYDCVVVDFFGGLMEIEGKKILIRPIFITVPNVGCNNASSEEPAP